MSLEELIKFYMESTKCTKFKAKKWAEQVLKEPEEIQAVVFQSIKFLLEKDQK